MHYAFLRFQPINSIQDIHASNGAENPLDRVVTELFTELHDLIRDLGNDGGLIGPSIYDTAQVVRLAPPASGIRQAVDWLVSQQQPDGGWGDPAMPSARDVPTLAAILALHRDAQRPQDYHIVQSGIAFLHQHMHIWEGPLPDALPVGIELLLPRLLDEAEEAGLFIPREVYANIIALGVHRRRMIAHLPIRAGTTPVHVWEGWGKTADLHLIDRYGSVGHSPAATAAWLHATSDRPDLAAAHAAHRYLEQAAAVTGVNMPGVVPTAWPITRFEQSNALYILFVGGLLDHPALQDVVQPQLGDLAHALRPDGLGFSDDFAPDGDDTAEGMAVLQAAGYPIDLATLQRFAQDDHYCAYVGELQPAISVTAHAVHLLQLCRADSTRAQAYMVTRQLSDGRWCDDKWNGSWLYTTSQVLIALLGNRAQYHPAVGRAVQALLAYQHDDGGWSTITHSSNTEETAYGILALRSVRHHGMDDLALAAALRRAEHWMLENYRPFAHGQGCTWLAKENYRPQRIVRMLELVATFPTV